MPSNYYTITVLLHNTQVAESYNDTVPLQADLVHIMTRLVSQVVKTLSFVLCVHIRKEAFGFMGFCGKCSEHRSLISVEFLSGSSENVWFHLISAGHCSI